MRFGFYSSERSTLFAWRRLQDEGHEVAIYHAPEDERDEKSPNRLIGKGFVKIVTSIRALCEFVGPGGVIVFDGSKGGEVADKMREKGYLVLCGGTFQHKLEGDREYGMNIAKEAGIVLPPHTGFKTISAAISFVRKHPEKKLYFKSDRSLECDATRNAKTTLGMVQYLQWMRERFGDNIPCMLQEKVEGIALSTGFYYNGTSIVGPLEGTLEHKKYLNGDLGPSTGCIFNVVWFYDTMTPRIARELHLDKIEQIFRREKAPPGLYDINAIIPKGGGAPYFLEWTPRFGYDSEPTAQLLLSGTLAELYYGVASGTLGVLPVLTMKEASALALRLGIPLWTRGAGRDDRYGP